MIRVGQGYDVHRTMAGRELVLGGVTVLSEVGLEAYSDGDVLTHAIMDAMVGATGLGDIGDHFPDSDPRWENARSVELLAGLRETLAHRGWAVRSVDATILCEAPRLAPYRDRMREELARALRVDRTAVNVKFGTNERLGFVGRGEGIAAMAVALVEWAG